MTMMTTTKTTTRSVLNWNLYRKRFIFRHAIQIFFFWKTKQKTNVSMMFQNKKRMCLRWSVYLRYEKESHQLSNCTQYLMVDGFWYVALRLYACVCKWWSKLMLLRNLALFAHWASTATSALPACWSWLLSAAVKRGNDGKNKERQREKSTRRRITKHKTIALSKRTY